MKPIFLFLLLIGLAPFSVYAQKYKHKSEAEISTNVSRSTHSEFRS